MKRLDLFLTWQFSSEQILIFIDGLGIVGQQPFSGVEGETFTLSAPGFNLATFQLLVQISNH